MYLTSKVAVLLCHVLTWSSVFTALPEPELYYEESRPVCSVSEHQCASGQCVDVYSWCDGVGDCKDNSDETDCGELTDS